MLSESYCQQWLLDRFSHKMSKLWISLLLAIVILDLLVETDAIYGCPRRTSTCRRVCRARGYTTGYCSGSLCRCRGPVCTISLCRLSCYRKGYKYGYCSGTRCRCRSTVCTRSLCRLSCYGKGYKYGYCSGTGCRCYGRTG